MGELPKGRHRTAGAIEAVIQRLAPLRVLVLGLDIFASTGGIQRVGRQVCKALTQDPELFQIDIFALGDSNDDGDARYLGSGLRRFRGFQRRRLRFAMAVLGAARRRRYDACFALHVNLAPVTALVCSLSRHTRSVVFVYGVEVWSPLSPTRRWALGHADRILTISQFTMEQMLGVGQLAVSMRKRIGIVPLGLDPYMEPDPAGVVDEDRAGLPKGRILLTVSRMSLADEYKGHIHVIRALPRVLERAPDVRYVVVGAGPLIAALSRGSRATGGADRVIFTGALDDAAVRRLYRQCEIFVMPSRREGFGLVYIEAMAHGKPVIATTFDAAGEIIHHREAGL